MYNNYKEIKELILKALEPKPFKSNSMKFTEIHSYIEKYTPIEINSIIWQMLDQGDLKFCDSGFLKVKLNNDY